MATVSVRYIVNDVDAAIAFYCQQLGFTEVMHPAPGFAMLSRDDLRLVLSAPGGGPGGGQAMPDGTLPAPGGWNRFQLEVQDIEAFVARLREQDVRFRNDVITCTGGRAGVGRGPSRHPGRVVRADAPGGEALRAGPYARNRPSSSARASLSG